MSKKLIEKLNKLSASKADIDQFLEIMYILDSHNIQYKMNTNFDIRLTC